MITQNGCVHSGIINDFMIYITTGRYTLHSIIPMEYERYTSLSIYIGGHKNILTEVKIAWYEFIANNTIQEM